MKIIFSFLYLLLFTSYQLLVLINKKKFYCVYVNMKPPHLLAILFILLSSLEVSAQRGFESDSLLIIEAAEVLGFAEEDTLQGWKFYGMIGADFGQTGVSNWVSGGENSVTTDVYLNSSLTFLNHKFSWDNYLFLNYGIIYSKDRNWQKAADRMLFSSTFGYHNNRRWAYAVMIDFNSQFKKGYIYPEEVVYKTNIFAPAYSNLAFGINYKTNRRFSYFMAPLTMRTTLCLDSYLSNMGAFGVTPGRRVLVEPGAYASISTSQHLLYNIDLISKIDFFTSYNKNFGNVDINWDILIVFKIFKAFSFTFNATLRYYEDEITEIQARDVLGAGFSYKF